MSSALPAPCDGALAESSRQQAGGHPTWTLAATVLGSSLAFVDGSVVNVALPALGESLGAGEAELSWAINAYLLPLGALILLGGAAGDHFGRRRLFLIGVALFLAASLACAGAPTFAALLAARGAQGVGAALLMPNSLAMLGAAFSGEARGRAIGTWAAAGAIAGAVGPLIGGGLVDGVGWRAIFLVNLPIGAAAGWIAWRHAAESRDRREGQPLDWSGAALATLALGLVTWALTAAADASAGRATVWAAAGGGLALLGGFVWLERAKGDRAMTPPALFATATFTGLTVLTFFLYAALGGLLVMLPFLLIQIAGYSATAAGAAMLPLPLLIGLGSRLMGRVAARWGGRWPLAAGAAIVAVGLVLFRRVESADIDYWRDLLPAIVVVAIGMAVSVAPLTTSVLGAVDDDHVGAASGFNSAVARVGGLIATALVGFVWALQGSPDAFIAGFRAAALAAAAAALVASAGAVWLIRPPAES